MNVLKKKRLRVSVGKEVHCRVNVRIEFLTAITYILLTILIDKNSPYHNVKDFSNKFFPDKVCMLMSYPLLFYYLW